jgi:hypothetical protein
MILLIANKRILVFIASIDRQVHNISSLYLTDKHLALIVSASILCR